MTRAAPGVAFVAALSACAACAVDAETITVPTGGARSLLFAIFRDGAAPELAAVPLHDTNLRYISVPRAREDGTRFYALQYACGLPVLGLPAGGLTLGAEGRALGAARAIWSSSISDGDQSEWALVEDPPSELAMLRIATTAVEGARCAAPKTVAYPLSEDVVLAFAFGDGAIVQTDRGRFHQLDAAGSAPALSAIELGGQYLAGHRENDARFVLFASDGTVTSASIDGDIQTRAPLGEPARWIATDGARGDAPFEIFTLTDRGLFARYDGARWTTIDRRASTSASRLALAWIGPGEAIAGSGPLILRARSGTVAAERPGPSDSEDRITAAREVPGLGTVAGTESGAFYLHDGSSWSALEGSPLSAPVRAIAAIPGSAAFLAAGDLGTVARFDEGEGFCPAVQTFGATLGPTAVLTGGRIFARAMTAEVAPFTGAITCE